MSQALAKQRVGVAMMAAVVLVYFSRPWSCGLVLSRFAPDDAVSYSHFDYHGLGVAFAWSTALVFAVPTLWLASRVFLNPAAQFGVFGRGLSAKTTAISILIALALGAPMYAQLAYIVGLPASVSAPVALSSLLWLFVVEIGRTAAVRGDLLDRNALLVATAIALFAAIPKLVLFGFALANS